MSIERPVDYHKVHRGPRPFGAEIRMLMDNPMKHLYTYRGYDVMFSGYKSAHNSFVTFAAWVAYRTDSPGMWVSAAGDRGPRYYQSKADPLTQPDTAALTPWTADWGPRVIEALDRLLTRIDVEVDGGTQTPA